MQYRVISKTERGSQVTFCQDREELIFSNHLEAQEFLEHITMHGILPSNYKLDIEAMHVKKVLE